MKMTWRCLAFIAFAVAAPGQLSAAPQSHESWCAILNFGFGDSQERCGIPSFEACRREAQIFGPSSFCRPDNWYAPYWGVGEPGPAGRAKKRRRVY
jgi:hypothetical protein